MPELFFSNCASMEFTCLSPFNSPTRITYLPLYNDSILIEGTLVEEREKSYSNVAPGEIACLCPAQISHMPAQ